jgi:DNA polymerase I-like protein with 3'-5' exonuclease and polymerase domains
LELILDTETTGLNKMVDEPFMLLVTIGNNSYSLDWTPALVRWLNDNLPRAHRCVFHNAKYDYHMMTNGGVDPEALYRMNVYCTYVAEVLLNEHRFEYNLDALGKEYFGLGKRSDELYAWLAAKFGGKPDKKQMANISKAPHKIVAEYGFGDVELTQQLLYRQAPLLERDELLPLMALEMDTLKALAEMERRGCPINASQLDPTERGLVAQQKILQKRIFDLVGFEVNSRSPISMEQAFLKLGLPMKRLPSGNYTFGKEHLATIDHPFITALGESRSIKTMLDTFINGAIRNHAVNGRIHTDFNQVRGDDYGTITGRLSSSSPNLQQVPKRDGALAPLVRGLFAAPKGMDWISNDWEQFEFRVFAHYVKDAQLTRTYHENPSTDFHQAVADMTGKPRSKAKRINLGLVFGMGEGKLAKELGLPFTIGVTPSGKDYLVAGDEAKQLFTEYHSDFPGAQRFLKQASNVAKTRGYVKTVMGLRLRFPGGQFVHKAGGLVFQGTSADIMKQKVVELNRRYRNTDVDFNLVVHDEYNLCAPKEISRQVMQEVREITQDVPLLRIPILADAGVGANWWLACTGGK